MKTTTAISVQDKVRNYQGKNRFLLNMKEALQKWGGLTTKQLEASEKSLNSEVTKIDIQELDSEFKKIVDYKGENKFVKDIQSKFLQYGTLTTKQKQAVIRQIQKEEDKERSIRLNWSVLGETLKIGRKIGAQLKEEYGLEFNPILIDITKIITVTPKAIRFAGKLTIKRGDVCMCCARTLTDEFSMLTKMGKTCAGHMKVEYITDASQAEEFRERYLKRVEEIGELEFWVPKSQIEKWDGITSKMVKTLGFD